MPKPPSFRIAKRSDLPWAFDALRAMAKEGERLSRFSLTNESLEKALFHDHTAEVLIAEINGKQAALALFSITRRHFDIFPKPGLYLHDIYILPNFRRQGLASHMVNELRNIAKTRELGRIDLVVKKTNNAGVAFWTSIKGLQEVDHVRYMRINL
jgi:ribosomal protein S18 acetylase RimI-like enzyme